MIRYTVAPSNPRAHLYTVRCEVSEPAPGGQHFRLPAWIRGSYLVRDFAKHVVQASAFSAGSPLAVERLDKRTLRCAPVSAPLVLEYVVYAWDESVRKAWLDPERGFFNGSSLFYAACGQEQAPCEVDVLRPPAPEGSDWKVATAMDPVNTDADGFGRYRAADYEELIDHPFELGRFTRLDFEVDGIPHAFVLSGRFDFRQERLVSDTTRICHVQRELFGQEPALNRYLFLTRVVGAGYGGLEHRASSALTCSRTDLPGADSGLTREYRGLMGLISHEYFHLWNVKRITPEALAASDLGEPAYTRDLWHYEGVTSYYDDLMLLRAGVIDTATYLDLVAETATRLQRTPGRHMQSLADASFEAWTKHYQPDENSPNAIVSYYVKGSLAALCLDLHLRRHSAVTLDDVMRELWKRHGRAGEPVPEGGLEQAARDLSGLPLGREFDRWLRSTNELPLAELLAEFGVQASLRAAVGETDPGGRNSGTPSGASLGLRLRPNDTTVAFVLADGPAQRAGISGGDVLVAMDGIKCVPARWAQRLATLAPGREYRLHFFRADELMEATLVADPLPRDTWTLELADASGDVLARRRAWLGA